MRSAHFSRIVVLVPGEEVRAWALHLADLLRARFPLPVEVLRLPGDHGPVRLPVETLEERLFGWPSSGHTAWVSTAAQPVAAEEGWAESLIVNAVEHEAQELPAALHAATILTLLFHGRVEAEGLLAPIARAELPHLAVMINAAGQARMLQGCHLAMPDNEVVLRVLDTTLARATVLLCLTVDHLLTGKSLPPPTPLPSTVPSPSRLRAVGRQILRFYLPKVGRLLSRRFVRSEDWCIGYRRTVGAQSPPNLDLRSGTFSIIESHPSRFYADPMLFEHEGSTALFFEDYDYQTRIGRISCVILDEEGRCGEPMEVLAKPYHLSYPFLFSHEGRTFMVPETSANRTVELYECEVFPHRWKLRSILMNGIEAADATFHFDAKQRFWWMFAAVTEFGSSSYDTLSIFFAEALEGPWRPHAMNPVKFDPRSSRPAGPMVSLQDHLIRPAQDCTREYGGGLVWCEIDELTPERFAEKVVAHHAPDRGYSGLHTYCRAGAFETVDFKRSRWLAHAG